MDWQERMNAALSYIEAHLEEELDWERAAAEANCSLYHFLKMFSVIAGVTAGEYVGRRRVPASASTGDPYPWRPHVIVLDFIDEERLRMLCKECR